MTQYSSKCDMQQAKCRISETTIFNDVQKWLKVCHISGWWKLSEGYFFSVCGIAVWATINWLFTRCLIVRHICICCRSSCTQVCSDSNPRITLWLLRDTKLIKYNLLQAESYSSLKLTFSNHYLLFNAHIINILFIKLMIFSNTICYIHYMGKEWEFQTKPTPYFLWFGKWDTRKMVTHMLFICVV